MALHDISCAYSDDTHAANAVTMQRQDLAAAPIIQHTQIGFDSWINAAVLPV